MKFNFFSKNKDKDDNKKQNNSIESIFFNEFNPFRNADFEYKPRQEIINSQEKPGLEQSLRRQVEEKRGEDPTIGGKLAGHEIFNYIMKALKNDKGIHFESLFAYLGSLAGRECSESLIGSLSKTIPDIALRSKLAGILGMMIVENTNGDMYLFGDRVGNEFFIMYANATSNPNANVSDLIPISNQVAMTAGGPEYWKTGYDEKIHESPKEIAIALKKLQFDEILNFYCRYPYERILAYGIAIQEAINTVSKVEGIENPKAVAADIFVQFGWRTSHYIWNYN